jgi:hypothetical protein
LPPKAADLLGAEPDDPDRPPRPARLHDPLGGGGGDRDAGGVVDRSGAEVPAVEMAADQDDAGLGIGARHLGDDVARLALADVARGQDSRIRTGLPRFEDALELLGVGNGERAGRDRGRRRRSLSRRYGDCGDGRCRSSG